MNFLSARKYISVIVLLVAGACTPESPGSVPGQKQQSKLEKGTERIAECQKTLCPALSLSFASLNDYSVLNDMTHVTSLELRYNTFENLEDISEMQQLKELRIVATKIRDVSSFTHFENLTVLHIQSALAEDIRPTLLQMPDLQEIAINLPDDGDISFVRSLPDLQSMSLLGSHVSSLNTLAEHPSLENLYIRSGLPSDLSALLKIPKLKTLSVFDTVEQEDSSKVIEQLKADGVIVSLIASIVY